MHVTLLLSYYETSFLEAYNQTKMYVKTCHSLYYMHMYHNDFYQEQLFIVLILNIVLLKDFL